MVPSQEEIEATQLLFGTTLHTPVSYPIGLDYMKTSAGTQLNMVIAGGLSRYLEIDILLVCKQVHHEAIHIVYENSAFMLDYWSGRYFLWTNVGCQPNLSQIRFLTMQLGPALLDKYDKTFREGMRRFMADVILPLTNLERLCMYQDYSLRRWGSGWASSSPDWRLTRETLLLCAGYVPIRHPKLTAPPLWAVRDESYAEIDPFIDFDQYRQECRMFLSVTMGPPCIRSTYGVPLNAAQIRSVGQGWLSRADLDMRPLMLQSSERPASSSASASAPISITSTQIGLGKSITWAELRDKFGFTPHPPVDMKDFFRNLKARSTTPHKPSPGFGRRRQVYSRHRNADL